MTTKTNSFTANLDHLILAVGNLERGIAEFEEKTGVKPTFGGVHKSIGTHNALVSLGNGKYLEILAPQDNGGVISGPFGHFRNIETLTPVGWVLAINDSANLRTVLNNYGIVNSDIQQMSREKADGSELTWSTIFLLPDDKVSINPFFIQWEIDSVHPSVSLPEGCVLRNCTINNGKEDAFSNFLHSLSLDVDFQTNASFPNGQLLRFGIDTPKGYIEFK